MNTTFKRIISLALVLMMVMAMVPAASAAVAAPTGENGVQWDDLPAISNTRTGQAYFTGNEWKGSTVNGVNTKEVFEVNREETRSSELIPYDSVDKAIEGAVDYKPELSDYYKLITGEGESWQLAVYKNWDEATAAAGDFYKPSYNMDTAPKYEGNNTIGVWPDVYYGGFKEVTLPASWQTQGFDFPIYTNTQYPWPNQYGNAGENTSNLLAPTVTNPVGLYRYWLDVDDSWLADNRKVFISFQGVESAYYLYVNGYEVGYTEDTFDAHDFDITPFLNKDGSENLIAVKVLRWNDGSFFENQDFLRLAGIFRDVYVYSTPSVYLEDYKVETDLDEQFVDADLKLDIDLKNMSSKTTDGNFAVDVKLFDAAGNNIFEDDPLTGTFSSVTSGNKTSVSLTRHVEAPHLWSDEDPYLYTLVMTLYDSVTGAFYECTSQQLGFREISFTHTTYDENYNNTTEYYQTMTLNGERFMFRGVDRHDNNPLTGRYVTKELYEEDITIMKQHNINAVRTSHYPDDRYFYYMCDKYGLLVLSECNVEDHRTGNSESETYSVPFEQVIRDRIRTHLNAEKNRTCIVMWSYGNESGTTLESHVIQRAVELMNEIDSTRPKHYEGLCTQTNNSLLDVISRMYAGPWELQSNYSKNAQHMPMLLCEYAHAMGNSFGLSKEYSDAMRLSDNLLGGFIWDYVDQSIITEIPGAQVADNIDKGGDGYRMSMNGTIVSDGTYGKVLDGNATLTTALNTNANTTLNNVFSGGGSFTVEAVVYTPSSARDMDMPTIFGKGDNQFALRQGGGQLTFYVKDSSGWINLNVNVPSNWDNNWHHVAVEVDNGTMKVFVDGTQLSGTNTCGTLATSGDQFAIGTLDGKGRPGDYKFAKVRIYNKALSASELTKQMNADKGSGSYAYGTGSGNVVLWVDFANTNVTTGGVWDYYGEKADGTDTKYISDDKLAGKYFAYGGQWGETRNDGNYLQNGIISANRTVQDEIYEVKYTYQRFWFTASEDDILNRTVTVKNESNSDNLSKFDVVYELLEDGKVIDSGTVYGADCAPGYATDTIFVPFKMPEQTAPDAEYYLNLSVRLKEDTLWAEAGHEIAWEQFSVPATVTNVGLPTITGTVSSSEDSDSYNISGSNFSLEINKSTGLIENYVYNGETVMTTGPAPNYWRGSLDNEDNRGGRDKSWEDANEGMTVQSLSVNRASNGKTVTVSLDLDLPNAGNSEQLVTYTIYATGEITVYSKLNPASSMGELTKFGAEITLPKGYENITWYGLGPWETLADRKQGAIVGLFNSTVSDSFLPYMDPQASGIKNETYYIAVEDPENPVGILVVSHNVMETSALHFTAKDYAGIKNPYQMNGHNDYTILNVDYGSRGTGGATCGPDTTDAYRLKNDGRDYSYTYTIVPYLTASEDITDLSKHWRDAESTNVDWNANNAELAQQTQETIAALDGLVVLGDKEINDIKAARAMYDMLPADAQATVTNLAVLEQAEDNIGDVEGKKSYITDQSANALHGDITDSARIYTDGTSPNGFAFTGGFAVPDSDDLVNSTLSGDCDFTIEFWVNPADLNANNGFVMKGDNQVSIKTTANGLEFFVYNGSWDPIVNVPFADAGFEANKWNHVAATYDGATLCLYVGGKLVGQTAYVCQVNSVNYPLGIGENYDPQYTGNRSLRGKMASTHVFSAALSAAEITKLYNGTSSISPTDANVIAWYDADQYMSEDGATVAPTVLRGDANQDGAVDLRDMVKVKTLIFANTWTSEDLRWADMNRDGKLTIMDIMRIKQIIVN